MMRTLALLLALLAVASSAQVERDPRRRECLETNEWLQRVTAAGALKEKEPGRTVATAEAWVQRIEDISPSGALTLTMFFNVEWSDRRLRFGAANLCSPPNNLTVRGDALTRIWTPDLGFVFTTAAEVQSSPQRNEFMLVQPDGRMWLNQRLSVTLPCTSDPDTFPHDTLVCTFRPQSLSYPSSELSLRWKTGVAVRWLEAVRLGEWNLTRTATSEHRNVYPAGEWSELRMVLQFKRLAGRWEWRVNLPSGLVLFVAWLSFFAPPAAITARVLLCLQALVLLPLIEARARWSSPQSASVSKLDHWLGACLAFVLAALVLNIFSHRLARISCPLSRCCWGGGASYTVNREEGDRRKILSGDESDSEERLSARPSPRRRRSCYAFSALADLIGVTILPALFGLFAAHYFGLV